MLPLYDSDLYYRLLACSKGPARGEGQLVLAVAGELRAYDPQPEEDVFQAAHEELSYGNARKQVYMILNQDDAVTVHACGREDSIEILPRPVRAARRERLSAVAV